MGRFPRLVAHLWAWTVETGWEEIPTELEEDEGGWDPAPEWDD
jgi:hypothetical protein